MGPKKQKHGDTEEQNQTPVTRKRRRHASDEDAEEYTQESIEMQPKKTPTGVHTRSPKRPQPESPKTLETRSPKRTRTGSPKAHETRSPKRTRTGSPKTHETRSPKRTQTGSPKTSKEGGDVAGCSQSRLPGIYEPSIQADPIDDIETEFSLFKKYETMTVLSDKASRLPTRVYFVKRPSGMTTVKKGQIEPVDKENYFKLVYHYNTYNADELCGTVVDEDKHEASHLPPRFLSPKWRKSASSIRRNKDLETVVEVFENLQGVITFEDGKWIRVGEKYKAHKKKLTEVAATNQAIGHILAHGKLIRAFLKRMTNAAGKAALKCLIDLTLTVCFGPDAMYQGYVQCNVTGSGPDKTERFPVQLTPSRLYHDGDEVRDLRCRSEDEQDPIDKVENWNCDTSSSVGSVSSKTTVYVKLPDGGIYADVIAISGCQPNFPRFLMVGEVKSSGEEPWGSEFSQASKSQLVREMLGALLHQTLVFGILISDTRAILCAMHLDFNSKTVNVSFQSYVFITGISLKEFNQTALTRLFLDMVDALNYSKKNIKEVMH